MEILLNVSDDLLSLSRGDVAAYKQATSSFVSSFRSDSTDAHEHSVASTSQPEAKSENK